MDKNAMVSLIRYFRANGNFIDVAASGNDSALKQILVAAGVANPSAQDLLDAKDLASAFDTTASAQAKADAADVAARTKLLDNANAYGDVVRKVAMQDPRVMAVYAGLEAVAQGAKAAGDISANNANKLAEAILSANRTNTSRQNETFGPSKRERIAGAWAANRQRKGQTGKIIGDAVGNTIEKVLGTYQAEDAQARARMMAPYDAMLGLPGKYYDAANQFAKRAAQAYTK